MATASKDAAYDAAIAYATDLGAQHGANAAGWYVQDTIGGRVSGDPTKAARSILRGIEDGDPAVTDGLPFVDLSGEWADGLTGPQLVEDAFGDDHPGDEGAFWHADAFTDVCDAYESAFDQAAEDAIASAARAILA